MTCLVRSVHFMIDPRLKDAILRAVPSPVLNLVLPYVAPQKSPWTPEIIAQNVIFIHVPKTAGSSLKEQIYGRELGGHRSLAEYMAYDRHRTSRCFKFCFVRNPWDRFLSAYSYLKQGKDCTYRDRQFAATYLAQTADINDFARALTDDIYRRQVMLYDHFRPQSHWICMPGRQDHGMDFIGRFEQLEDDMQSLRDRLDLPDTTLPKARKSRHDHYRAVYSDEARDMVMHLYQGDLDLLAYDF